MQDAAVRAEMVCPLNGKLCISGKREDFPKNAVGESQLCRWWVHLYGKDPGSEKILDQHDCSIAWLPVTSVEGAQMTRQLTATLDKHNDEMRNNFEQVAKAVTHGLGEVARRPIVMMNNPPMKEIENKGD